MALPPFLVVADRRRGFQLVAIGDENDVLTIRYQWARKPVPKQAHQAFAPERMPQQDTQVFDMKSRANVLAGERMMAQAFHAYVVSIHPDRFNITKRPPVYGLFVPGGGQSVMAGSHVNLIAEAYVFLHGVGKMVIGTNADSGDWEFGTDIKWMVPSVVESFGSEIPPTDRLWYFMVNLIYRSKVVG